MTRFDIRNEIILLALILGCFSAAPARATVPLPPAIAQAEDFRAIGSGELRWLLLHVYDATLWGLEKNSDPTAMTTPFALSLRYHIDITRQQFVQRTFEELERVTGIALSQWEGRRGALESVFADVRAGDTITAYFTPPGRIVFYHNGRPTGNIDDVAFAPQFFSIWLGKATSAPQLRQRLLGRAE